MRARSNGDDDDDDDREHNANLYSIVFRISFNKVLNNESMKKKKKNWTSLIENEKIRYDSFLNRPSYFVRVPSYVEALWYPHLYFDGKSNM